MDTIPNAMNRIDKVCLKVLPRLAMLKSVRVYSAVKISAFNNIPDRSQILMVLIQGTCQYLPDACKRAMDGEAVNCIMKIILGNFDSVL
jgi:hypothetical protein